MRCSEERKRRPRAPATPVAGDDPWRGMRGKRVWNLKMNNGREIESLSQIQRAVGSVQSNIAQVHNYYFKFQKIYNIKISFVLLIYTPLAIYL